LPFCPDCGASIDEEDKFCRSCGKQLQPAGRAQGATKPASAADLAKIAGIQERIKEFGRASNWSTIGGALLAFLIVILLVLQGAIYPFDYGFAITIFILIYIPFAIMGVILAHYKGKLQQKLEKGELT